MEQSRHQNAQAKSLNRILGAENSSSCLEKKTSKTKREKTKRIDEEKEAAQEDRLTNYFLRADKKNCGHCER